METLFSVWQTSLMNETLAALPVRRRGRPRKEASERRATALAYEAVPASPMERMALARRARERRHELGLSRVHMAAALQVGPQTLGLREKELPKRLTESGARRWEEVLAVPRGWLTNRDMETPAPPAPIELAAPVAGTAAAEILAVASWLARAARSRRTFEFDRLTPREQRRATIFAMRYGFAAAGKQTLARVGAEFSLTRERIRQIVATMLERAADLSRVPFSVADQLSELVPPLLPATDDDLMHRLEPLLGGVSIANADLFAREVLGRRIVPDSGVTRGLRVASDDSALVDAVHAVAKRMIRAAGAAQIHTVFGLVAQTIKGRHDFDDIARIARALPAFEWLDEDNGWFWAGPDTGNRVTTAAMKILAACGGRVDVEEIMAGLTRERRERERNRIFFSFLPPGTVVVEMLRRTPSIRTVQFDKFELRAEAAREGLLSESESAILDIARAFGGVVQRQELAVRLVDTGTITNVGLQFTLAQSPIVRQLSRAVYAIRGIPFDGRALERTTESIRGPLGYRACMDRDGWLTSDVVVGNGMRRNRAAHAPAALARHLTPGAYTLDGGARAVRLVNLPGGQSRFNGLAALLFDAGFVEGDKVRLRVHPERRLIRVDPVEAASPAQDVEA